MKVRLILEFCRFSIFGACYHEAAASRRAKIKEVIQNLEIWDLEICSLEFQKCMSQVLWMEFDILVILICSIKLYL